MRAAIFLTVFLAFSAYPALAAAEEVLPVPTLCQVATHHQPDADVNYTGGVDVHGNPVVPADIQSTPHFNLPDPVVIPVEMDVLRTMGVELPVSGIESTTEFSEIRIYRDGRVEYNGHDIQREVGVFCGGETEAAETPANAAGEGATAQPVTINPAVSGGQDQTHVIKSGDDVIEGRYPPAKEMNKQEESQE